MKYWWEEKSDVHEEVMETFGAVHEAQSFREEQNLKHMRLYGNYFSEGMTGGGYARLQSKRHQHRVTLNVVQSMCDTVVAKIAKNRPKATFLTSGGSWTMQRRAKLLDKFCEGQFYSSKIYQVAPKVFLDAAVFGTGIMKIYEQSGTIKCERVFPNEILVDDEEAIYGDPRQLFQVKQMHRDILINMFPESKNAILSAKGPDSHRFGEEERNQVICIEAWHLPSDAAAIEGRHVICIDGATLLDEGYSHSYYPFVFIRWTERLLGFYGQGLAEQLTGSQYEINKLLQNIQDQMHLAKPKVFVEAGSKISKAHLNNETWGVIEYSGTPPQFFVPKTVSGEIFSHLDRLFNRAYEITGVSQLAAQSRKPAGLDSGVALREFSDIETERFMIAAQNYEAVFLDAARQMIGLARDIDARGDTYEVISHGDKFIEKIKWKDVNLKEDEYVMKVYPTSLLPTTPAAKLQKVIEMLQAGMLTQQEARGLLDYPDIEAVNQIATAAREDVQMLIEQMLDKGLYVSPEPFSDLEMSVKIMQSAYLRAKLNNAPEDRLELVRRYIEESVAMMVQMQQAQMMAQQAAMQEQGMMGQPPGDGGMGGPEQLPSPSGATPAGPTPEQIASETPGGAGMEGLPPI